MNNDFLEFGGKNRDKPDPFIKYINSNFYSAVCLADPYVCDPKRYYTTKESIDQSESIDVDRMDPSKLDLYINMKGGTSSKNLIHMGQMMKYNRF